MKPQASPRLPFLIFRRIAPVPFKAQFGVEVAPLKRLTRTQILSFLRNLKLRQLPGFQSARPRKISNAKTRRQGYAALTRPMETQEIVSRVQRGRPLTHRRAAPFITL